MYVCMRCTELELANLFFIVIVKYLKCSSCLNTIKNITTYKPCVVSVQLIVVAVNICYQISLQKVGNLFACTI